MKRYIRSSSISGMSQDERKSLAMSSNDLEVLANLADDEYWVVRLWVARRVDDPKILTKLADDEDTVVRKTVAERTDDPEILAKLADDAEWSVREIVAKRTDDPELLAKIELANKNKLSWPSTKWWYGLDDESFEDAWQQYLSAPESEVNDELQIFPEPSVQGSMGGLFVYDESGEDRQGEDENWYIDWQEYLDWQIDAAATSKNASQYKKKYRSFMKNLCGI